MRTLDIDSIRCDFMAVAARLTPTLTDLARQTLERIPPSRWEIEWFLAWWLGQASGLDQTIARDFVLSSVLGLAAIRLQDDLADGDVAAGETASAAELAHAWYDAALETYRHYFSPASEFWTHVDACMIASRAASGRIKDLNLTDLSPLRQIKNPCAQLIAQLGAPLKIPAHAVCKITGFARVNELERLLEHIVVAAVLHDHVVDCDDDLRAERWNLFVAAVSPFSQNRATLETNRARVAQAWMKGETPRAYFQLIAYHIARAQQLNRALEIQGIAAYLDGLHLTVWRTHDSFARAYREELTRAAQELFGALFERSRPGHAQNLISHKFSTRRQYGNP